MKRDLELPIAEGAATASRAGDALVAAIALAVAGIVAIYWETAQSIVAIWIRSETYAHCFAVVPISLWLAWRQREAIAAAPARPWWPGLLVVALMGAVWLVANTAQVLVVKQFAFAFMIEAAIVTVVGLPVARAAAFPLLFLLFAIPAGEALVPMLIDRTADFTVAALRISGVPVYREGNQLVVPTGVWSVVEACSGIRYLIASMMVGTIYAMLSYKSTLRRIAFFAASIVVPIVANWMRAYLIVLMGHLSGNRIAVGVDHLIYGWIFFGIVMLLLFWVGSWWSEPAPRVERSRAPASSTADDLRASPALFRRFAALTVAVLIVALVWRPLDAAVSGAVDPRTPALAALPGAGGWVATAAPIVWTPEFSGATVELAQAFRDGDRVVGVYVAYYRNQVKGRELVTSTNTIVKSENGGWLQRSTTIAPIVWNGRETAADWHSLSRRDVRLAVVKLYWIAGRVTSSDYVAKALLTLSRLSGRGDDSALIVAFTREGDDGGAAHAALGAFCAAMSPAIERVLSAARDPGS
jgi:exosortase A